MNPRKKAIVTGASSGIGRATAIRFATDGWDVCINARREESLCELLARLPKGDHLVSVGDYSDAAVAAAMSETLRSPWGRLDALVNCAGAFQSAPAVGSPID